MIWHQEETQLKQLSARQSYSVQSSIPTLPKSMKLFAMNKKSIFSWSTAKMDSYLRESIAKDAFNKQRQQKFFIRFYQRFAISAHADSAIETLNPKTFCLMNTGMQNWSILDLAVMDKLDSGRQFAELLHIALLKSLKDKYTILSLWMYGVLESLCTQCLQLSYLLKEKHSSSGKRMLLLFDSNSNLTFQRRLKSCLLPFLWMSNTVHIYQTFL